MRWSNDLAAWTPVAQVQPLQELVSTDLRGSQSGMGQAKHVRGHAHGFHEDLPETQRAPNVIVVGPGRDPVLDRQLLRPGENRDLLYAFQRGVVSGELFRGWDITFHDGFTIQFVFELSGSPLGGTPSCAPLHNSIKIRR